jgi:ferredoxin
MQVPPQGFTMDWWYLAPLVLTDRLSGGAIWAITLVGGTFVLSMPWLFGLKRPAVATVVSSRCNACKKCYLDCPYDAIVMVPRTDDREYDSEAFVRAERCVGCGICAGSCDTSGVGLDWLSVVRHEKSFEVEVGQAIAGGDAPFVAYVCAESLAGGLDVDPESHTSAQLPGFKIQPVPCIGWVHPGAVERLGKKGTKGVLFLGCTQETCAYREGSEWERLRLSGERSPALRETQGARVAFLAVSGAQGWAGVARQAEAFRDGADVGAASETPKWKRVAGVAAVIVTLGIVTYVGSDFIYASPPRTQPNLLLSLTWPGKVTEDCRERTAEELEALPAHMRRAQECDRERSDVRVRIEVDGVEVLSKAYPPSGLFSDGRSVAVERIPVTAGARKVRIQVADTSEPDTWPYEDERDLEFELRSDHVVTFESAGFRWD